MEELELYTHFIRLDASIEELRVFLENLFEFDNDFNGVNGADYLWSVSKEKGFNSNLEFLITETFEQKFNNKKMIKYFVNKYFEYDGFYDKYIVKFDDINDLLVISIVTYRNN